MSVSLAAAQRTGTRSLDDVHENASRERGTLWSLGTISFSGQLYSNSLHCLLTPRIVTTRRHLVNPSVKMWLYSGHCPRGHVHSFT